ncbi:hypothetical protein [Hymenobacter properus]|uniref:DUF5689 domain-containing protein n=1 Tax=Hymenobacter properus TaxID=2791026 RepID=A0A931BJU3_9BACT|nr:hypothetical protein [Hymenobacter properus]MBF9143588.1 hypothetical protein [Hymenobacter properus]MBR7722401.1 hypothetical protein [Microvirga sp. SRT04]
MKAFNYFSTAAILAGSLLFATGCEKASVAPELAAPSTSQNGVVKDRAIETRVTGTFNDNGVEKPFVATLRVEHFEGDNTSQLVRAICSLQQVAGGLKKADSDILEAGNVLATEAQYQGKSTFNIVRTDPNNRTATGLTIIVGGSAYIGAGKMVYIDPVSVVIDSNVRGYNQMIANGTLAAVANWYDATDHTDLVGLGTLLDNVADYAGRF